MLTTIKKVYEHYLTNNIEAKEITIQGWVKSNRNSKKIGFLDINDGSTFFNLQVVYTNDNDMWEELTNLTTGSAISIVGNLIITNKKEQPVELKLYKCLYKNIPSSDYPIQKKAHSYEFLREQAHLRARTNTFFAVFKIRNTLAAAIHNFFQTEEFLYLNSPLITSNDAEGAGENFIVTTITNDKYENDFFAKKASLTVSGQLNAEAYAQTFKKVYTFGPTFRAENSNTTRHAAEFWMVEPEFAFADLNLNIKLAKDMLVFVIKDVLKKCELELNFLNKKKQEEEQAENLLEKLMQLTDPNNFKVLTYTEVIEHLLIAQKNGEKFVFNDIKWGMDLQSEHERYICEKLMNSPTFVINYPQDIKAFYMKLNPIDSVFPERKTVAAMDLLVPGIGELIGGSVREDDYSKLMENKEKFNINDDLKWYFDLRKSGYAPSAGFGLGFERLIMFVTGINNIRDVIPFPRTPNNLMF